jgi:hypothetical protein
MVRMRFAYKILVGNSEGKKRLARPRFKWENNINADLKEMCQGVVWI